MIDAKLQAAVSALQAGRHAEAERLLRRLLRATPNHAEAAHCLGIALLGQNEPAQALTFLDRAARLAPATSQLENNRATALGALGRHVEALAALDRALALAPADPGLHYNRGNTLVALGRDPEALAAFRRTTELAPDLPQAWQNMANVHGRRGAFAEALAANEAWLRLLGDPRRAGPLFVEAQANRAWALDGMMRRREALAACDAALAIDPDFPLAHINAAPPALALGDYERGLAEFEWRWRGEDAAPHVRHFAAPRWLGAEPLAGRHILLHAEQGFGDTIQFCRYVPRVKALGAEVTLEVPAPLVPLLATLAGHDRLIATGDPLPAVDVQTPLMSLPFAMGTRLETIPADVPYLAVDPARVARFASLLGPRTRPRIGLAWAGNPKLKTDAIRSAPLSELAPLLDPGLEFIAVQRDLRPGDAERAAEFGIRLVGAEARDFADAAALVSLMDVVVSVDSGPAHLAGALGRPVFVLLYHAAEWRWLEHREDSPWYPTARLFRQTEPRVWRDPVARVAQALREML